MTNIELINSIRRRKGLKLKDIAGLSGYSIGYICTIFSGKLVTIPKTVQSKVARILGVKARILFKDSI